MKRLFKVLSVVLVVVAVLMLASPCYSYRGGYGHYGGRVYYGGYGYYNGRGLYPYWRWGARGYPYYGGYPYHYHQYYPSYGLQGDWRGQH